MNKCTIQCTTVQYKFHYFIVYVLVPKHFNLFMVRLWSNGHLVILGCGAYKRDALMKERDAYSDMIVKK